MGRGEVLVEREEVLGRGEGWGAREGESERTGGGRGIGQGEGAQREGSCRLGASWVRGWGPQAMGGVPCCPQHSGP